MTIGAEGGTPGMGITGVPPIGIVGGTTGWPTGETPTGKGSRATIGSSGYGCICPGGGTAGVPTLIIFWGAGGVGEGDRPSCTGC